MRNNNATTVNATEIALLEAIGAARRAMFLIDGNPSDALAFSRELRASWEARDATGVAILLSALCMAALDVNGGEAWDRWFELRAHLTACEAIAVRWSAAA